MNTSMQMVWVAIGGALGAITRFGIAELARRYLGQSFPIGTLIANLTGCFLIGILLGSGNDKSEAFRLGVGVGFLGALTTFSTFGLETIRHINEEEWFYAIGNVLANVILGLTFVTIGIAISKKM